MVTQKAGRKVSILLIVHKSWQKCLQSAFPRAISSHISATMAGTLKVFVRQQGNIFKLFGVVCASDSSLELQVPLDSNTTWYAKSHCQPCLILMRKGIGSCVYVNCTIQIKSSLFNHHLWCQFIVLYPSQVGFCFCISHSAPWLS